jgi:hypothetical protein
LHLTLHVQPRCATTGAIRTIIGTPEQLQHSVACEFGDEHLLIF